MTISVRDPSWSSLDSDAYSSWSSPQDYNMPITVTSPRDSHASTPIPHYAFTQPPTLNSNASITSPWNWTTTSMHPSMHDGVPATSSSTPDPSYYGYDDYSVVHQPMMSHSPTSYVPSLVQLAYTTMPNRPPRSTPQPTTTTEQPNYQPNTATTYPDPRHPHNSMYQY